MSSGAFGRCTGITSIALPHSLRVIGKRAFKDCTGLKGTLKIADSVVVGPGAFQGCHFNVDYHGV